MENKITEEQIEEYEEIFKSKKVSKDLIAIYLDAEKKTIKYVLLGYKDSSWKEKYFSKFIGMAIAFPIKEDRKHVQYMNGASTLVIREDNYGHVQDMEKDDMSLVLSYLNYNLEN